MWPRACWSVGFSWEDLLLRGNNGKLERINRPAKEKNPAERGWNWIRLEWMRLTRDNDLQFRGKGFYLSRHLRWVKHRDSKPQEITKAEESWDKLRMARVWLASLRCWKLSAEDQFLTNSVTRSIEINSRVWVVIEESRGAYRTKRASSLRKT